MEQIKTRIAECELEYDEIKESSLATDEEIQELASYFSLPLPEELVRFYKIIGGIESDDVFCISSAQNLTRYMKQRADFAHNSTGIIDMIIAYWGNDRPELMKYKLLTQEQTEKINTNFQCIGWMTSEEDVEESSEYVIFDQNGNFTNVYCHQDDIKATTDQLLGFLESGLPERTLKNVLQELFKRAEGTLSRWD